ncbi:sialoadhesin-like isoform X15 [Ctenopharyngodon idella]|uniref:sialoadhesin-like isoform X15 n=1 Tax=Ctenopharyngodon idella TaxID=7959 RepID=UPI0022325D85|nr:sialoadhesin-like isoform X15 [Ctenopharyngodon idella]
MFLAIFFVHIKQQLFLFLLKGKSRNVMGPLLLKLLLQAVLLYDALAWRVTMPKSIRGLQDSCLVIPCSFSYSSYPPKNPRRVVWYQWVSKGYPLVYDPWYPNEVIDKFRWKTDLYGNPSNWDCSLLITNLEQSHHGEKLYAWIDPENVGWRTYAFYDVTSTIHVDTSPQSPSLMIYGGDRTGDTITVACSTFHTCPYSKPNIILKGIEGSDQIKDVDINDGLWKTTLTRTGVVKAESSTIECSVTHHGGKTVKIKKDKSAQCFHHKITIKPELADVTEGVAKNFSCSVYHSCQKETPTITWNYENMQVSTGRITLSSLDQVNYSNITFLGSKEDHGKKLICTAKFSGGNIEASVALHVQQYQKPSSPIQNETYFQYEADVIPKITALPRSCVVIPCSFKIEKEYVTQLRVLWVTKKGGYMFHTDSHDVLDNFRGRTKLLGNPDEQNCTVEMDNVQTHDNGPFCFRAEKENEKYSFNNSCVFIIMRAPDKPVMSSLPEDIEPGTRVTVRCSVNHTCSSHPPKITWSVPTARETISHNHMGGGIWETVSAVTFIPTGYEEKDEIVCSANFWGGKTQQSNTAFLNIKRVQGIGFVPYIIASSLVFILICILAGVFIYKRQYRQPLRDMQGSRSELRRSVWNRFTSHFNMPEGRAAWNNRGNRSDIRYTENAPERPPKPEQRRSIWSRFSRNQSRRTNANLRAEYKANNTRTVSGNKPFSKPHKPSPKRYRAFEPHSPSRSKFIIFMLHSKIILL